MAQYYVPPVHPVPRDDEDTRFIKCFRVDQEDEYIQFFNEFGFVVVRDVLTSQESESTIDDIWNYIEKRQWTHSALNGPQISRADPTTGSPPVFTAQALRNRQNPNIYKVFSSLLGQKDLLVNHDRYGLFRPTVANYNWKTFRNIHIDMNPWMHVEAPNSDHSQNVLSRLTYNRLSDFIAENNEVGTLLDNQLHLQGLINLAENFEKDGGFHIVPGFKNHLVEWATRNSHLKQRYGTINNFIVLSELDPLDKQAVRVTARAGSLVVWDQRTIHGSDANDSHRARYQQE